MTKKILILAFITSVFTSCSSDDVLVDELNVNRQLWESLQIENYKWNERLSCECGGPLQRDIFVVNGIKNRVDFDETLLFEGFTSEDVFNRSKTVEEAFDFIESLLNQSVASLGVEYDATYGFPTIVNVDYDANFVDDEILYRYTNFETPIQLQE